MAITKGALYSDWSYPELICAGGIYITNRDPLEMSSISKGDWRKWSEQADDSDSCSELFSKGLNTWGT